MNSSRVTFDHWEHRYAARMETMRSSAVRDLFAAASREDIISLSGGMPAVKLLNYEEVIKAATNTLLKEGPVALQYGSSEGRLETRKLVCDLMEEVGVPKPDPANCVMLSGAQQGLDLLAKIFIDPGDVIICEGPTYVGALQAFSAYEPDVHCIEVDDQGIRTDLLEEELNILGRHGAKFIYVIPNFQNPTGVTMTLERRKELVRLSREYDIPIIEDDPYGRLRYEGSPVPPLRSLDDSVIYLGTFSKIFSSGIRLGWLYAPEPIIKKIKLAKGGADLCGSAFSQIFAEHYFAETPWRETLATFNEFYKVRRDAMLEAFEEFFPPEAHWTHPEGGFFIWITLPPYVNTNEMVSTALDHGVVYVSGDGCFPDGRGYNALRVAFCYESPEDLREAVRRLGEVFDERLELYRAFIKAGALPEWNPDSSKKGEN
jgi:2-aminoadipate transaminase